MKRFAMTLFIVGFLIGFPYGVYVKYLSGEQVVSERISDQLDSNASIELARVQLNPSMNELRVLMSIHYEQSIVWYDKIKFRILDKNLNEVVSINESLDNKIKTKDFVSKAELGPFSILKAGQYLIRAKFVRSFYEKREFKRANPLRYIDFELRSNVSKLNHIILYIAAFFMIAGGIILVFQEFLGKR